MDIRVFKDIIKDERENDDTAVKKENDQLILVNALLERSCRTVLECTKEFRETFAEYEGQFIGKIAADQLRARRRLCHEREKAGSPYSLDDVAPHWRLILLDTIGFYRHPKHGLPNDA